MCHRLVRSARCSHDEEDRRAMQGKRVGWAVLWCATSALASAQVGPELEQRLQQVERDNLELRRRLDAVADELERETLGDLIAPLGASTSGLGPASSKVYGSSGGVSIGGYGEALFKERQGGGRDEADALRSVLYVGYKFDPDWVFNSEIEFEHGVAADGADGEVAVEFAYLDGRVCDSLSVRSGLVLIPMGLVNERHEPTTFPSANRPWVERVILPATWRELGLGAWGQTGSLDWRAYVVNGMDAAGFSAGGVRGGRQNGSEALAEDLAAVARIDWLAGESLTLGGSAYFGDSGQEQFSTDVSTAIAEAHAHFAWRALTLKCLYAQSELHGVAALNNALGLVGPDSIGERMRGGYFEASFDVLSAFDSDARRSLEPFVRLERYDTQASVPGGFASDPQNDVEVVSFGIAYRPNDHIVFKLDFNDFDNGAHDAADQLDLALGFTF